MQPTEGLRASPVTAGRLLPVKLNVAARRDCVEMDELKSWTTDTFT